MVKEITLNTEKAHELRANSLKKSKRLFSTIDEAVEVGGILSD